MSDDYEDAKLLLEQLKNKYFKTNEKSNLNLSGSALEVQEIPTSSNIPKEFTSANNAAGAAEKRTKQSPVKKRNKTAATAAPTNNTAKRKLQEKPPKENVITLIDPDIINDYGSDITEKLQQLEIYYKFDNQICPHCITWINEIDDTAETMESNQAIVILNWKETVSFIKSNSLISHIKGLKEILVNKKIYLGIYGMENYFKYWKTKRKNMEQSEYKSIKITRDEFEFALTEVQFFCDSCYRLVNNSQDIVDMICQFTKAVIQLPDKLKNKDKYKNYNWHMLKDNKDSVAVDKNGVGLKRLWKQQLTTFEMARLEIAEAIVTKYPTPSLLLEEYEKCTEDEGRRLLGDIQIRRAAGPMANMRRIGFEFSNKVYNFFNFIDGDTVL